MRGFVDQSIFTSQFSYLNLEYRLQTAKNSYLYSITDFGTAKDIDNTNNNYLGIGFGYQFLIKNSLINLGYTISRAPNSSFDFNNSRLNIQFKSYF